jgi:hypothetical protein
MEDDLLVDGPAAAEVGESSAEECTAFAGMNAPCAEECTPFASMNAPSAEECASASGVCEARGAYRIATAALAA